MSPNPAPLLSRNCRDKRDDFCCRTRNFSQRLRCLILLRCRPRPRESPSRHLLSIHRDSKTISRVIRRTEYLWGSEMKLSSRTKNPFPELSRRPRWRISCKDPPEANPTRRFRQKEPWNSLSCFEFQKYEHRKNNYSVNRGLPARS